MHQSIKRWLPLALLLLAMCAAFYWLGRHNLSFSALHRYQKQLLNWTEQHRVAMLFCYAAVYILVVILSLPGATGLTIAGGFVLGVYWATVVVVIAATMGATVLFLVVRTSMGVALARRASHWVIRLQRGFQAHALSYLLVLRLVPLFPFWVINIVPALLNINTKTFIIATFFGIIPGTFVYALLGNGLGHVIASGETPNIKVIYSMPVLLPLLGLAVLSLLPAIYRVIKKKLTAPDQYQGK